VLEPVPTYPHGQIWGYVPDAEQVFEEQRESGKELLVRVKKLLSDEGFRVTTALDEGNPKAGRRPGHCRFTFAQRHGAFLARKRLEAVARHANCSVEIVRDRHH
jgi:hypothetical protein